MSRFTLLTKLEDKSAQATARALCQRLASWPSRTITADNGPEHTHHALVSQTLGVSFFFCHPYHSWEKGTVEGTIACSAATSRVARIWVASSNRSSMRSAQS